MPYFVLAGAYFSGRFALGEFTQAAYAFSVLQSSMALVVDQFQALTDYASVVNRLAAFEEFCEKAASKQGNDQPQIEVVEDDSQIALKNVTLATPDRARVLQQHVSLAVADGDSLLLTGPTSAGKTSLMGLSRAYGEPAAGESCGRRRIISCSCRKSLIRSSLNSPADSLSARRPKSATKLLCKC